MSKIKSYFVTLIAVIAAVCCFGLAACAGNEPSNGDAEYNVMWTVGEHATVTAAGYDTLPAKLKSGTVVTFTITMDEGWELVSVLPTPGVTAQADGSYKFTVSSDTMIIVATVESVEIPPVTLPCIVGWAVGPNVTVAVEGYDELPLSVEKGTVLKFSVTPDEGYIATVLPETAEKQSDGTYTVEVTDSLSIIITAEKAPVEKSLLYVLAMVNFPSSGGRTVTETIDDYTREVFITPFTILGGFEDDGQSAYIKLVEVESRREFVSETVTRDPDDRVFKLEFDWRAIVDEYEDIEFGEYVDFEVYICAKDSEGKEYTDRVDTADYELPAFIQPRSTRYLRRNVEYTVDYYSNTTENPDNTKLFIAITAAARSNYSLSDAQIVVREENGKNVPYLDIKGQFYASYKRTEAMEALNNFVEDICAFGNWDSPKSFTQSATLDDSWQFTVSVDISKLPVDYTYVMHAAMKAQNTDGDNNLMLSSSHIAEVVSCDGVGYELVLHNTGWGWNWPGISIFDLNKSMELTGATIKAVGGKPFFTFTYTYVGYTREQIEALPVNFALQCNDNINGGGWAHNFFDNDISFVIDEGKSTFDIRIDISSLRALHGYTTKLSFDKNEGVRDGDKNNPADFKPDLNGLDGVSVVCGDLTYKFMHKKGSNDGKAYWGCLGVEIVNTPGYSVSAAPVQLVAEDGAMYLTITGTYTGYTVDEIKAIAVDYQNPDSGWATIKFTAEQISVSVDEDANTFTFKIDLSGVANGQYFIHFNYADVGNPSGIEAIACGDRNYSYENRGFDGWSSYVLTIRNAE